MERGPDGDVAALPEPWEHSSSYVGPFTTPAALGAGSREAMAHQSVAVMVAQGTRKTSGRVAAQTNARR